MKVYLEQNGGTDSSIIPYFANIEVSTMTVDFNTNFMVPIAQHINGSTTYKAEVCGFDVTADSPEATVSLVEKLVQELVNLARLPTYVFIARRSHKMYPVYTFKDEVFATTPGGPVFRHIELAKVREYLSDYMHTIGQLGTPGKSEALHVRGIHRKTLGLVRPIFYLKKRAEGHDSNEFWAPVFPSQDGQLIYAYAVNDRREADIDNGHEILRLRSQVAQALITDGRLKEDFDLRADRLLPEYWEKVAAHLDPLASKLSYKDTTFDMYKEDKHLIAVECRTDEDRYSFYIGKGTDDLRTRAAKDLLRRNLIANEADVKVEGVVY